MYISIIRQIRGKMCVLVNMIFIMEEVNMWEISNNGTFEKWTSNICIILQVVGDGVAENSIKH